MDFRVSEAQRELAEGIRTMLAGRLPLQRIRTREGDEHVISADDWAALGDTGVFSLTLPEPAGIGLALSDAVVVFEELGRALVPGPLVGTFLAASRDLVPRRGRGPGHGGCPRQFGRWAPVAGGAPVLAPCRPLPPRRWHRRGPDPADGYPRRRPPRNASPRRSTR